jgi:hypothetical protein
VSEGVFKLTVPGRTSISFSVEAPRKFYLALEHQQPNVAPAHPNEAVVTASVSLRWADSSSNPPQLMAWVPYVTVTNQNAHDQPVILYFISVDGHRGEVEVRHGKIVERRL